jgi:cytidylate kinase
MNRLTTDHAARLIERHMAMHHALQRSVESHAHASPEAVGRTPEPGPYVTVSREYGARGSAIAARVAERLGWTLYDRALLDAVARDAHLQERLLHEFDERQRTDMENWVTSLLSEHTVSEHDYSRSLFRVLSSLAQVGRMVVVGRGAHLVLPPDLGLRVRIHAPMAVRIGWLTAEEHLSEGEAKARLTKMDHEQAQWLRRTYGERLHRWPNVFDLELNAASFSVDACTDIVIAGLDAKLGAGVPTALAA